MTDIKAVVRSTRKYNFHSHTRFCDGHAPMDEFVDAARTAGLKHYGFSPHSPFPHPSPCNMADEAVRPYIAEVDRLKNIAPDLHLYASMEIDYISPDFGPHIDRFQCIPLDYRIGSVHFVRTQDGRYVDCDGSPERFVSYLREHFQSDLRYVVEKYYEQVLMMIERGGFDILAHFDKIGFNASHADSEIEHYSWYEALIDDVIGRAASSGLVVEVNTKHYDKSKRFYPNLTLWLPKLIDAKVDIAVNSDAHWPDKIEAGRNEAFDELKKSGADVPDE